MVLATRQERDVVPLCTRRSKFGSKELASRLAALDLGALAAPGCIPLALQHQHLSQEHHAPKVVERGSADRECKGEQEPRFGRLLESEALRREHTVEHSPARSRRKEGRLLQANLERALRGGEIPLPSVSCLDKVGRAGGSFPGRVPAGNCVSPGESLRACTRT